MNKLNTVVVTLGAALLGSAVFCIGSEAIRLPLRS